jgi:hypothetical protein
MSRKIPFYGDRYSDPLYLSGWSSGFVLIPSAEGDRYVALPVSFSWFADKELSIC